MQVDYQKAEARPSLNFWPGNDGRDYIVVHATASGGVEEVPNFDASTGKSTTYAISRAGKVVQYVSEQDSHWGNCCTSGASPFVTNPNKPPGYNYNHNTIAIENEKYSSDNSESLEAVQYEALLELIRDIAARWKIPLVHGTPTQRGVIFHHDLDPVNKGRCPGTFPYGTFFTDLNQGGGSQPVKLNAQGCVCDVIQSNQLFENEMELCGPWAAKAVIGAGFPGKGSNVSVEDIDVWVDNYVTKEGFTPANFPGVSIPDEENILRALGDHWQEIPSDVGRIRKAVQAGYPVLFTANEANIFRWGGSGWVNPYNWKISANHVLPVTGIDNMGNFICPDQLSSANPWPPIYDATRLNPSYAVIVQLPFLAPIPNGDPNTWPAGFNAQNVTGGTMGIPTGWKPGPNNTIVAPNNVPVATGFMVQVEKGWDANNYPIKPEFARNPVEQANTALGPGTWQNFRQGALAYTVQRGVYVPWVGQELQWYMDNYDSVQKERDALKQQVTDLQAQLAASTGGTGIPQVVKDDIISLASHVTPAASVLDKLVKDAGL